jgi:hypothetical protein
MRRTAAAVVLAGTALLLSSQAGGSSLGRFEVHLRVVPIVVDTSKPVRVRFTAYSLTTHGRVLSDVWQFRLVALSPTGTRVRLPIHHVARGVWIGAVRLRTVGTWQIRLADWPAAGTGPIVRVKVREPVTTPTTTTPSP